MSRLYLFPLVISWLATPALAADPSELIQAERQALISQIERCAPPLNIDKRRATTIELRLNADGSVAAESKVVASPTPEIGKATQRAAMQCQPYRLPGQNYEKWKHILADFDARSSKAELVLQKRQGTRAGHGRYANVKST